MGDWKRLPCPKFMLLLAVAVTGCYWLLLLLAVGGVARLAMRHPELDVLQRIRVREDDAKTLTISNPQEDLSRT